MQMFRPAGCDCLLTNVNVLKIVGESIIIKACNLFSKQRNENSIQSLTSNKILFIFCGINQPKDKHEAMN